MFKTAVIIHPDQNSTALQTLTYFYDIPSNRRAWETNYPTIPYDRRDIYLDLVCNWSMTSEEALRMMGIDDLPRPA